MIDSFKLYSKYRSYRPSTAGAAPTPMREDSQGSEGEKMDIPVVGGEKEGEKEVEVEKGSPTSSLRPSLPRLPFVHSRPHPHSSHPHPHPRPRPSSPIVTFASHTYPGAKTGTQSIDPHFLEMQKYPEAPWYWYLGLLILSFVAGLVVVIRGDTTLPVWGYLIALLVGCESYLFVFLSFFFLPLPFSPPIYGVPSSLLSFIRSRTAILVVRL